MNWAASRLSSREELYKTGGIYMPKGKEWIVSGLGHLCVRNGLGLCVRLPYWCWLENCRLIKTTLLGEVVFNLGTWSWFAEVVWEQLTPFGAFHFFFSVQFSSVWSLSCVWLFASTWTVARQASLPSPTREVCPNSCPSSWLSNHLIFCCSLLLLPSIFPSIRVFSKSQFFAAGGQSTGSFNFSISPSNEYSELISFRIDWVDLLAVQGTQESYPTPQFKSISSSTLSFLYSPTLTLYMTTGKARAWLDRHLSASNVSAF